MKVKPSDYNFLNDCNVESLIIHSMIYGKRSIMIDIIDDEYVEDLRSRGFEVNKLIEKEPHKLIGYRVRW